MRLIIKCQLFLGDLSLLRGKALCDVEDGEQKVVFHMCKSICQPNSNEVCYFVDLVTDVIVDDTSATVNMDDMLEVVLLNFDDDEMGDFMEYVNSKE